MGVNTTSDRDAGDTQEARRACVVSCARDPGEEVRAAASGRTKAAGKRRPVEPTQSRGHSLPGRPGVATHQLVGAAIISLGHRPRGIALSSVARRPKYPSVNTPRAILTTGVRPAGRLYRPAAFPDSLREARSSLGTSSSSLRGVGPTAVQRMA